MGKPKKMTISTNSAEIHGEKKNSLKKSKSLRPLTVIAHPSCNKVDQRHTKNIKHIDDSIHDIRKLSGTNLISKSTAVLSELTSHSILTKESFENNTKNELDTNLTPKVFDGLMNRMVEMSTNYEKSLQTVESLADLMKEISTDFKTISHAMNENVSLLQHNTIQKFHALENKEKKILKKYRVIEYMVKKFGDELEKTRKSFNIIRSKQ